MSGRRHALGAIGAATAVVVLVLGCGGQSREENATAFEDEARAASVAWDDAFNAGDVGRLMALYADAPASMPYERPALEGKAAIEVDFEAFFKDFTPHHETTIVAVQVAGDWAIERGRYTLTATPKAGGDPFRETGKHIVIRKKMGAEWKIVWEIWNLDAPLPK